MLLDYSSNNPLLMFTENLRVELKQYRQSFPNDFSSSLRNCISEFNSDNPSNTILQWFQQSFRKCFLKIHNFSSNIPPKMPQKVLNYRSNIPWSSKMYILSFKSLPLIVLRKFISNGFNGPLKKSRSKIHGSSTNSP